MQGVDNNLSGITYSPATDTLFAIVNSPEMIVELTQDGKVRRTIQLSGFRDTEGISHVQNTLFAVVEERDRRVTFVEIDAHTRWTDHNECASVSLKSELGGPRNKGLEGIAWAGESRLFLAHEDRPGEIFSLAYFPTSLNHTGLLQNALMGSFSLNHQQLLTDVAGLHVLENGNILVLSEQSKLLLEYSREGDLLSRKSFNHDPFGFFPWVNQPEGVVLSNKNRLYIVSEPNELFISHKNT